MSIELDDITSGYNVQKINSNFQKVENYVNDNLLHRAQTGVAGEAMMERDLDMNGNEILNYPVDVSNPNSLVNKGYVDAAVGKSLRFTDNIQVANYGAAGRANSLQGYDSTGNPVPIFSYTETADLAFKLASHNNGLGAGLIGAEVSGTVADKTLYYTPEQFGAKASNSTLDRYTNALAFQTALNQIQADGGGKLVCKGGSTYYIGFPIYVRSNTDFDLNGATLVFVNPVFRKGRGGIVIGSSYEANYDQAMSAYSDGSYATNTGTTENTSYVNPAQKQWLRDNPSFTEVSYARVHNGRINAYFDGTDGTNGGYGINFVNSAHCSAYDVEGSGWTQLIGMGSDVPPETPSNYDCHAYNLTVTSPDLVRTFYSIGFIANSTECSIRDAIQVAPITAGTNNGSGVATNFSQNCTIENISIPNLGQTVSSEGVLINNTSGSVVRNIMVRNCRRVVSTFYVDVTTLDVTKPNIIQGVSGTGVVALISLRSKYDLVSDFVTETTTPYDILLGNTNASGNIIKQEPSSLGVTETSSFFLRNYLQNNTVKGYARKLKYIRPADILTSQKSDTNGWNFNKTVTTKAGVDLQFLWEVPDTFKALDTITLFCSFNATGDAAFTAGSTVLAELIQMTAFDGNINTAPYTSFSNTRVAATGQTDTSLTSQYSTAVSPGFALMSDTTNGLSNSWYVHLRMYNNVNNNYMKEIRISYWG